MKKQWCVPAFNLGMVLVGLLTQFGFQAKAFADRVKSGPLTFERITVDDKANGPSFAEVTDLNGDGKGELIISKFGEIKGMGIPFGEVTIYQQGANLREWKKIPLVTTKDKVKFPNHVRARDLTGNGLKDLVVPVGFLACEAVPFGKPCGGLLVYEQYEPLKFKKHQLVKPGFDLFFHDAQFLDMDGTGTTDFVTVAERQGSRFGQAKDTAVTVWFKGKSEAPFFELKPRLIANGLGGLPTLIDLTGNGLLDIASAEYFYKRGASFAWIEQLQPVSSQHPNGLWKRHVIDDTVGPSIQLSFIENFFGDGKTRAVGSNHSNTAKNRPDPWESAIYVYDIPQNPRNPWPKRKISQGIKSRPGGWFDFQMAPGIFGDGDLTGNGLKDLIVSGDGDDRVFWLEQYQAGQFKTHVLQEKIGQAGAMKIYDFDNDGNMEALVSGYENSSIYIFKPVH